jgi:TPR repeat protein
LSDEAVRGTGFRPEGSSAERGQGNADAQAAQADRLFVGRGVEADVETAARFFRMAADQGHAGGMNGYAVCVDFGFGGRAPDAAEAARLFKQAADAGSADARVNYGCCLRDGSGVTKDVAAAKSVLGQVRK